MVAHYARLPILFCKWPIMIINFARWSGSCGRAMQMKQATSHSEVWSRKSSTSQIFKIFLLRHTTGLFILSQLKSQSYVDASIRYPTIGVIKSKHVSVRNYTKALPLYRKPSFTKKAWCEKCKLPDTCSRLCWSRQTIRCCCHEQIIKYQVAFWWSLKN